MMNFTLRMMDFILKLMNTCCRAGEVGTKLYKDSALYTAAQIAKKIIPPYCQLQSKRISFAECSIENCRDDANLPLKNDHDFRLTNRR